MLSLTQAQLQWIFLNYNADKQEENDKIKLLAYVIDPQRAKAVFEPQPEESTVVASSDWFLEEVKKQSSMRPEQVEELLKTDPSALGDPNFTVISKS
jgi:hypothetical protein